MNNKSSLPRRGCGGAQGIRFIDRFGATAYIARMALREILILPDKRLRQVSEPVKKIDAGNPEARRGHVRDDVRRARASGLPPSRSAPPSAWSPWTSPRRRSRRTPRSSSIPEIVWSSDEKSDLRGGLPVDPGILRGGGASGAGEGEVSRPRGEPQEVEADGLLATCLQHEIDHLNGVLFIDHISKLKRDRVIKKFTKAAKRAAE